MKILIHIVTWNSERFIEKCIESVREQRGFTIGENLFVRITDNASSDSTVACVGTLISDGITLHRNDENIGFCGGHNQGVRYANRGNFSHILILNPDVALDRDTLSRMVDAFATNSTIGMVTPKLLRANEKLLPILPSTFDAAGMYLTDSLRHFDRGAGQLDSGEYDKEEYVFGGTGACLLLSLTCARALFLPNKLPNEKLFFLYPQLRNSIEDRDHLFDEAFFAYREDADLAWRAGRLGWKCLYVPKAHALHVRVVTPERRADLPAEYNLLGVRNRFLLQINNWTFVHGWRSLFAGIIIRNLVVIAGVIVRERSSLPACWQVFQLLPRAKVIRRHLQERVEQQFNQIRV